MPENEEHGKYCTGCQILGLIVERDAALAALASVRDAWWSGVVQGDNEYHYTDPDKTMDAIWIALGEYGTPDKGEADGSTGQR